VCLELHENVSPDGLRHAFIVNYQMASASLRIAAGPRYCKQVALIGDLSGGQLYEAEVRTPEVGFVIGLSVDEAGEA
jgi:hypothetical protein